MKCDAKTSSKNLGKLMKSGDTKPTHPISNHSKWREADSDGEIEVEIVEDLNQFDLVSYEDVLKTIASSKTNLLKNASTKSNRATFSIMGLIDDGKEQQAAGSGENNTSAPVQFEEIDHFIDSGEEEIIGKPQSVVGKKLPQSINVTLPVCGNPVTDFDKMNEMNENNEAEGTSRLVSDPVSLMEMGTPLVTQENAFEEVNLDKINKSQKNIKCDESEQLSYLNQRTLEFNEAVSILGPVSKGEFASFNQSLSPVVGCDLGVLNPITMENYKFYAATSDGQLLAAIPRTCYALSDRMPKAAPTTARKQPIIVPLRAPAPSTDSQNSQTTKPYSSLFVSKMLPPLTVEASSPSTTIFGGSTKLSEVLSESLINATSGVDPHNDKNEDIGKENKDKTTLSNAEKNRLKRQKEKLKKAEEAAKKAEEAAKKAEETAKQKAEEAAKQKAEEAAKQEAEKAAKQKAEEAAKQKGSRANVNEKTEKPSPGVGSAQQDDSSKNQQSSSNARRSIGQGSGKNKKTEKGVSSEYTVALPAAKKEEEWENKFGGSEKEAISGHGDQGLERALKELGIIDVSELVENPPKKKKGNKKSKQQQQQQQQKKDGKEAACSTSDKQGSNDGADKNKKQQKGGKKMDELADAASIANRSGSGAGQQSEEDDDQSYVSAQENLGGSNSQLSTPPAEFADAPQARDDANDHDNVMNDPANYRDDEEVELVALQLQREEEDFITVGKNNKKHKNKGSSQDNASSTSSSNSPPNRRNTHPDTRASSATGSNNASSSGPSQSSHNQHQRSNNRPVAHSTTLGDFMDATKKDTHKNTKHKKGGGPSPSNSQKKQASLDDTAPGSPTLSDAVETPISVNTTPAFSYADAAKKTSGENTPALEMSPVPAVPATTSATSSYKNQSMSSAQSSTSERKKSQENVTSKAQLSTKPFSTAVSGVQLPPSVAATACDISFGYEETLEDKLKREKKEAEAAASQKETTVSTPSPQKPHMPTRMNGADFMKTFNDGSGSNTESTLQEMPKGANESTVLFIEMINSFKAQWDKFENTGSKPVMFTPSSRN